LEAKGIAGLLSFLKDEENLLPLLQLGAGLSTGSRPGSSFGEGLLTGLNGYIGARNYQDQRKEAAQLREARANVLQRPERLKNIIGQPAGSDALIAPPIPETPQLQIPQGFGGEFSLGQTPQLPTPQVPDLSFQRPATGIYAPENAGDPSYLPRALIAAGEPELGIGLISDSQRRNFAVDQKDYYSPSIGHFSALDDKSGGPKYRLGKDGEKLPIPDDAIESRQYFANERMKTVQDAINGRLGTTTGNRDISAINSTYRKVTDPLRKSLLLSEQALDAIKKNDPNSSILAERLAAEMLQTRSYGMGQSKALANNGAIWDRLLNAASVWSLGEKTDVNRQSLEKAINDFQASSQRINREVDNEFRNKFDSVREGTSDMYIFDPSAITGDDEDMPFTDLTRGR
jgi:hypothetical protein